MAFANLSLSDTFFTQIIRINEHTVFLNNLTTSNVATIRSNTSFLTLAGNTNFGSTIYLNVTPTQNPLDNSASNIASANMVFTAMNTFNTRFGSDFSNLSTRVASDSANSVNTVLALSNSVNATIANSIATVFNQANAAYNSSNTVNLSLGGALNGVNTQITAINSTLANKANSFITSTVPQIIANSTSNVLTTSNVYASQIPVNLGNVAGLISLDFATFLNANAVMTANITFNLASNVKPGVGGVIELLHSGLPRTLNVNTQYFSTPGNTAITLSQTAGIRDALSYYGLSTGKVLITPSAFNV